MLSRKSILLWMVADLIVIAVTILFMLHSVNHEFTGIRYCLNIPSQPNKTEVLFMVAGAKTGSTCADTALNIYGQETLNSYNISSNISQVEQQGSQLLTQHTELPYIILLIVELSFMVYLLFLFFKRPPEHKAKRTGKKHKQNIIN